MNNNSTAPQKLSILMANYNRAEYIRQAIESVIKQTSPHWELVIVDDGSTDNSVKIIKHYLKDNRIKLVEHGENKGCAASVITAIDNSSGDILGRLDSDDALRNDAVKIILKAYKNTPEYGMIYSNFYDCDERLNIISKGFSRKIPEGKSALQIHQSVSHFTTYTREAYDKSGGIDPKYKKCVDRMLTYKLEEVTKLRYINRYIYFYRRHEAGISQTYGNAILARAWNSRAKVESYFRRLCTDIPNLGTKKVKNILRTELKEKLPRKNGVRHFFKTSLAKFSISTEISAMVRVKNEETFAFVSLESIKDLVDEIIIVDNLSTDNTIAEINRFIKTYPNVNVKLYSFNKDIQKNEATLADYYNYALNLCTKTWILKWDLDNVACTEGEHSIFQIKEEMHHGGPIAYYYANLWGDLEHRKKDVKSHRHSEHYVVPKIGLKFVMSTTFEIMKFDWNVLKPKVGISKCLGIHCSGVKPSEQILYRYWWRWMEYTSSGGKLEFKDYLLERFDIKDDSVDSILEAADKVVDTMCRNELERYDEKLCPYPPALQEMRKTCRFKVNYKNGKIIGRTDSKRPNKLLILG